jgi:hypothetical protein
MTEGISLVHGELLIPIILGGIIVFGCYSYKEWQTRATGRFGLNTIIALVTILALSIIILEPTHQVEITDQYGLVLTDGFNDKQKDSVLKLYDGIKVLHYNPKKSIHKELDSLYHILVVGNGIKPYDFYLFDSVSTTYIQGNKPSGISRLNFTDKLLLGQQLEVSGSYSKPKKGTSLILQDSRGNGLDSIHFFADRNTDFNLGTNPKASGKFLYQLTVKDSSGLVLNSNRLPIEIGEKEPLRILILNDFPTFETKYLKNFLADENHEVIIRSQLTKGKFKFEYFNTPTVPVLRFTDEVLSNFDVIITDAETYDGFGKSIHTQFQKNIRENGIGLFIQPSNFLFNSGYGDAFFKFKRDGKDNFNLQTYNTIIGKYPYESSEQVLGGKIALDGISSTAVFKQLGLGRIATSTILNSYQLLLNGNRDAYHNFWTKILDKIAKRKFQSVEWEAITKFPKIDEPFTFQIRTNLDTFTVISEDSIPVSLLQESKMSNKFTGTIYPKKKGWNSIEIMNDSASKFSYYVFDSDDWNTLNNYQTISANKKQFGNDIQKNRTVVIDRPISPILFYILFLLGVGWLWLSPKLSTE